jgi:hypothetical protein
VHALVIVEMTNPRRQFAVKCEHLLGIHKCLGPLLAGAVFDETTKSYRLPSPPNVLEGQAAPSAPDTFATELYSVEALGPCVRLVFTAPIQDGTDARRDRVACIVIPTTALPNMARQLTEKPPHLSRISQKLPSTRTRRSIGCSRAA